MRKKRGPRFLVENFQTTLANSYWRPSRTFLPWERNADAEPIRAFMCCRVHQDLHCSYTQHHPWQNKATRWLRGWTPQPRPCAWVPSGGCSGLFPWDTPGGPVWGAELTGAAPHRRSTRMPCRMRCHALQMPFCWQGSSASKIGVVLPVPGILCVRNSFVNMLLTYVLGKIPQECQGWMMSNKTLRREGFKRVHCQLGETF